MKAWILALLVVSAVVCTVTGDADTSWFLTKDELDAAMSGFQRDSTGLHTFSLNNTVTPLLNGNVFMADLYDNLVQTGPGDFIHACMWDVNLDMLLKPDHKDPEASKKTKLETVLLDALDRGVDVRLLISANQYQIPIATCRTFNPKCKEKNRDCCAPDIRHPHNLIGSMHVKMWTLTRKGELLAYIGGMDVSYNRWDTWDHDPDNPDRLMQPQHIVLRSPWHDHHVRVQGDGAYDLERTFWQRWSDKVNPYTFYDLKPYPFNAPVTSTGPEAVQVVRTFGCQGAGGKDGYYKDFAPHGDYSYQALFLKAVSKAKKYIYVEDQFMTYPACHQALANALPHVDFVVIATNIGSEEVDTFVSFNLSEWQDTIQHYQYEAFKVLMGSPKVHTFVMGLPGKQLSAADQIYNHAKTLIGDDEFILTGSCGVERAGWTNDHEMSVGIVTPGVSGPDSFAGRFRRKLWGEWLSIRDENDPVLTDPKTALDALIRQADAGNMRPRHYWPQDNPHFYSKWIYEILEPDGRCDAATAGIPDEMLLARARAEATHFNSPHYVPEKWVD